MSRRNRVFAGKVCMFCKTEDNVFLRFYKDRRDYLCEGKGCKTGYLIKFGLIGEPVQN